MQHDKEVTVYDIVRKLKISPATVSRGLNDHPAISKNANKKIFDLADKFGYTNIIILRPELIVRASSLKKNNCRKVLL